VAVVYKITCIPTGKIYIGWTSSNAGFRFSRHYLDRNKKRSLLARCIKKYGREQFSVETLFEFSTDAKALAKEVELIALWKTNRSRWRRGIGMNLTDGGEGTSGYKFSEAHCKKQSERLKGHLGYMSGKKHSQQTRERMSEGRKGSKNSFFGRNHTVESKAKISQSRSGIKHTDESKARISKNHGRWNKGKKIPPLSEEQKLKISRSLMGRETSPEHRRNLSRANMGKPSPIKGTKLSEEHRAALKAAWVKRREEKMAKYGSVHSPESRERMKRAQIARAARVRAEKAERSNDKR
jgi:group I intron endonuclease